MATILLIEDSDAHRAEICAAIKAAGLFDRVLEARDGLQGLKLLVSETIDVVLCDLEMPGLDGEKLLSVRKATPRCTNVPFLFLTATDNLERRARLLEDGASDVIAKPFHAAELVARLRLQLKVKRLHDELVEKHGTLARLSTVDALTGLRTRRYTQELLSVEFLRSRRYDVPMAVIMADIDHFKHVNDCHGHPAGDAVLRGVSDTLLATLRATDTAGRWGGEEILVVLSHNDLAGAHCVAERWRESIERSRFKSPEGEEIGVTISMGVAEQLAQFESPDDIVAAADRALYRAKAAGRNRTVS
jgi:diguanylate cyclase (GGDEF)-like protein